MKIRLLMLAFACLAATLPASAQGRGPGGGIDGLINALSEAGATTLSTDQQTAITSLITTFRQSQTPPAATASSARTAYETAIIAGNKEAALAQVSTLSSEVAAANAARLSSVAAFSISVLKVLDTSQISLLVKQFGTNGVVRLIESLAGGPGMGGGRGPGMMGMRPPM